MRARLALAALVVPALLATGCGGDAKRSAAADYLKQVNAVEKKLAVPLAEVTKANRALGGAHPKLDAVHGDLVRAQARTRAERAKLAALQPPADARKLQRLLLELVDRQIALTGETAKLARFLPRFDASRQPLRVAAATLQQRLANKHASPAAKAAALDTYAGIVGRTVTALRKLDPFRKILLAADGSLSKTGSGLEWLLNFDATAGPNDTFWTNGTSYSPVPTDGNDVIFGDLGNDWAVGGTGRDTLWGGWGNDYLNADDVATTDNGLNDQTDTNPSWEDFVYGGAGVDVMLANTGGDRLVDWSGEWNSYLTPFSPFGMPTVSRDPSPQLQALLVAFAQSQGADPYLSTVFGGTTARNGEPYGEIGEVTSSDPAWGDQHGSPRDPQPGNSHGTRDVRTHAGTLPMGSGPDVIAPPALPTPAAATSANATAVPLTFGGPAGGSVRWTVSDGVRSVSGTASFLTTTATVLADLSGLADGTLTVTSTEVDAQGNSAQVQTTTLRKDTTPPAATLALDGGAALTRQKTLALALADDGTAVQTQLQVTLGSTVVYSGVFTGSVALGADGTYTVVATLSDADGNTSTVTRTIVLDTAGPAVAAQASGAVYDVGAAVAFTWGASDASGIAAQTETLDGAAIAVGSALDVNSLTAGTHTIQISATDGAGNVSTQTITFAIHPTAQGILAALDAVGFFVTPTLKASLVGQMQYVIAALPNGNSATPRLRSFISMVQSATAAQIAPAYQALLLSWANDLLARI